VEFALVLPLLLVMSLALVQVGLLARDRLLVEAVARAGARVQLDPMTLAGTRNSLCLSAHYPVQVPTVGDALELVLAGIFEGEA
jgi:hypothetical protein